MNEAQIITGLRACSAEAHEALYDEYAAGLYDYCHALLGDADAAVSALRETLLRAAASIGSMPAGCTLRAWLFALARSQCRSGGDRLIEHPMPEDDPSGRLLVSVLGTLTPRDREVLELTGRHGLTEADLEPVLGLPPDRVASLVADARRRFDHAMAEELDLTGPVACPSLAGLTPGADPLPLLYTALPMAAPPSRARSQTLDDLLIAATTGDVSDPLADTVTGMAAYGERGVDPFEAFGGGTFDAFGVAGRDAFPPVPGVEASPDDRDLPDGDDAGAAAAGAGAAGAAGAGGGHRRGRSRRRAALVGGAAAGVVVIAAGIAFAVGTSGGGQDGNQAASQPAKPGTSTVDATDRPPSGAPTRHATDPHHRAAPAATPAPSATDAARHGDPGSRTHPTGGRTHLPAYRGRGYGGSASSTAPPTHGHRPPSSSPPATSRPPTGSPTPTPTPTTPTPQPTTDSATPSDSAAAPR